MSELSSLFGYQQVIFHTCIQNVVIVIHRFFTFVCANKIFKKRSICFHCRTLIAIFNPDDVASVMSHNEISDVYHWMK